MNPAHNLTNAQVQLALGYIDRAAMRTDNRFLRPSERYQRLIDMVIADMDDALIHGDIYKGDLVLVRRYFASKRDAFINESN